MSKAGSMGTGMAWLIAFGSVLAALVVNVVGGKIGLPWFVSLLLYLGIFGVAGYLATYMTQASSGTGILAFLVAGLVAAIGSYILVAMVFSAAGAEVSQKLAAQGADAQRLAQVAGSGIGAIAGAGVAVFLFLMTFIGGLIGCLIGSSAKNKALGSSAALRSRAA